MPGASYFKYDQSGPGGGNRALGTILRSPRMRTLLMIKGLEAKALWQAHMAEHDKSGRMASSARVDPYIGGRKNDRWEVRLVVPVRYAAAFEFGHHQDTTLSAKVKRDMTMRGTRDPGQHILKKVLGELGGF